MFGGGRLHPHVLLAPFADTVELTAEGVRGCIGHAAAQLARGFQTIDVCLAGIHSLQLGNMRSTIRIRRGLARTTHTNALCYHTG